VQPINSSFASEEASCIASHLRILEASTEIIHLSWLMIKCLANIAEASQILSHMPPFIELLLLKDLSFNLLARNVKCIMMI